MGRHWNECKAGGVLSDGTSTAVARTQYLAGGVADKSTRKIVGG